ncbi:leukocyte receptor cluster member 1 homolog [Drosophila biarmipes]|uniref:leukocyte receptor cluster member 1 homolog n=1 Tax=Drosophila biarmipes TaxID=125945 RepID=UPI0007E6908E|nr:leukocyte receptor cluster member 1 homolog [Drosophila biarmipes]XP_050744513.1 leukocyte receptor cluster member 1 homolog [Drosophila biarmipes]
MNILPKKRWHVRTKENMARVRRDQAAAAAEEKVRQDKLQFAESEARINFLRRQSGLPEKVSCPEETEEKPESSTEPSRGVDLFADYKSAVKTTNKDLEKEQKEEQEKYEKKIGYLTYLGQDTNEALKVRSWYEVAPKRPEVGDPAATEAFLKQKLAHDPLTLINALLPPEKKDPKKATKRRRERTPTPPPETPSPHKSKKSKKDKKHSKHKKHKGHKSKKDSKEALLEAERHKREKLERLRKERLRRETAERQRSEALFAPKEPAVPASAASTPAPTPRIVQKYNSQFNPEIAKQNML